ncbi:unnamed protein product [Brachionus calyciflorus]|uniref:Uncharacterized protein n=1 Tax=Brachionus calyciflorus TaxID=104777 RepID=A0A814DHJ8_9BILA|nr:unnamed protein product [Brachionus calyciflorus]
MNKNDLNLIDEKAPLINEQRQDGDENDIESVSEAADFPPKRTDLMPNQKKSQEENLVAKLRKLLKENSPQLCGPGYTIQIYLSFFDGKRKYLFDENFRISYRGLQAKAFIPVCDIIEGFKYFKQTAPCSFSNILD